MASIKTGQDYQEAAAKIGARWAGESLPSSVMEKTAWLCLTCSYRWEVKYNHVQQGSSCPKCAGVVHRSPGDYKALAESLGLVWLGPKVENVKTPTKWLCVCGREWIARYSDVAKGKKCNDCGLKSRSETRRAKPDEYKAIANQRGFTWLGPEAKNSKTKTEWLCPNGHKWFADLNHIRTRGCPECAKVSRAEKLRHPIEDYYKLAQEKNCIWLGPEVNTKGDKTNWQCQCGYKWATSFQTLQNNGCPDCSGVRPKTPEDYHILAGENNFTWLGPKVPNVKTNTWWLCSQRHKFDSCYSQIQSGAGCRYCAPNLPKTPGDYLALAQERSLEWLGGMPSGIFEKSDWKCLECGNIWKARFADISRGTGCPKCAIQKQAEKQRLKPESYRALAEGLGYQWKGPEAKNARQKTWWICNKGHSFKISYDNLSRGQRCKHCTESTGEQEVSRILRKLGVDFETQKTFDDCRDKKLLRFDFYFRLNHKEYLVEYDGSGHFELFRFLCLEKAEQALKNTQRRDAIKNEYAKQKGMVMIRIPYTEFERIEEILKSRLV